jgi:hypothetical protein
MTTIHAAQLRGATVNYTPQYTKLTIASNKATVTRGHTVTFSGTITPRDATGTALVLYIRKSGSSTWTTLSAPSISGTGHWSYAYAIPATKASGTYYVRVYYPGSAVPDYDPSYSSSKKLVIKK